MPIITPKTQAQEDLILKEQLVVEVGEATHHLASVMQSTNKSFWALPTERLLDVLNQDAVSSIETLQANESLAVQVNASLDALALDDLSTRAPVEPGRSDIIFDGNLFVYVPPVEIPLTP